MNKLNEFRKLRFGMFIHFGLYSRGERTEWQYYTHWMNMKSYQDRFLSSFNPDPKAMEQWVLTAKKMGAKYITVTSKHHDGFCLWDTQLKHELFPEYHIRNTEFWKINNTDVLTLLFEAGRKHGVRIGLYYSSIDFSWSEKPLDGPTYKIPSDPQILEAYNQYYLAQLHELKDLFPDILLFWLDGYQFKSSFPQLLEQDHVYHDLTATYPDLIVASNTGHTDQNKSTGLGDIILLENPATDSKIASVSNGNQTSVNDAIPGELCLTLNHHWGYNGKDKKYKNPEIIAKIIKENDKNHTNTLLNFGPHWNGFIPDDQIPYAEQIGAMI